MTDQASIDLGLGVPFAAPGAVQGGSLNDMGDAPQPLLPGSPDTSRRAPPLPGPKLAKPIDESDPTSVFTGMPSKAIMALRASPTPELQTEFDRKYDRRYKKDGDDKPNYFDQFDNEPDTGDPALTERLRLNAVAAFWRDNTLLGTTVLSAMAQAIADPDAYIKAAYERADRLNRYNQRSSVPVAKSIVDEAAIRKQIEDTKQDYEWIVADLIKYDSTRGYENTLEALAALAGQVGGTLPTPETLAVWPIRGASLLGRMFSGGVQGAVINTITDPPIQYNAIRAGVQDEYSFERTALAPLMGFAGGAALTGVGELAIRGALKAGTAMSQPFRRKTIIELGKDDPSIRRPDIKEEPAAPPAAPQPETPRVPPAQMTDTDLRVNFERAQAGIHEADDVAPEAVRRFGVSVENETTFYRAEQPGRPDLTDATSTPVTDRIGAEDYAFDRNKDTLEKIGQGQGGELIMSEVIVPPGTPLLTSREVSGAVPNHEAILPPGKFVKVGERTEQFQFGTDSAIGHHRIKTYRFEPLEAGKGVVVARDAAAAPQKDSIAGQDYVSEIVSTQNVVAARMAGVRERPGERAQISAEAERVNIDVNAAAAAGDMEKTDALLRRWEHLQQRLDEIEYLARTASDGDGAAPAKSPFGDDIKYRGMVPDAAADLPARAPIAAENGILALSPDQIGVDAERFQFKGGGDAEGVSKRLKGVTKWDPILAGLTMVWEDNTGKFWIVDGHQRLALAKRIAKADPAQNPRLNAVVLRESDGLTDGDVRAKAAIKNIAEGTGTSIDAAKVLRARPELISQLPPKSELVRQGNALVNLSEDAFRIVTNEIVPAHYAAVVGDLIPTDGKMQVAVLNLLAKYEPANMTQAEAIVRQAREAGLHTATQDTLFGAEDVTTSLFGERAKVLDRALKQLKKDKTVFETLVKESDIVTEAGNILAGDANARRAQASAQSIQVIQILANKKGVISDALTEAARKFKEGKAAAAIEDFVGVIRREVEGGNLGRDHSGGVRGLLEAEAKSPASDATATGIVDQVRSTVRDVETPNYPIGGEAAGAGDMFGRLAADMRAQSDLQKVFLSDRGMTIEQARALDDTGRAKLNDDWLAWNKARDAKPEVEAAIRAKPDSRQGDIFGGAQASQRDLAQRAADARMLPGKEQKPLDFGLFGDEAKQTDLVDMARARPRSGGNEQALVAADREVARSTADIATERSQQRIAEAAVAADKSPFIAFMRERFGEGWTGKKGGAKAYDDAIKQFIEKNPGEAGSFAGFMLVNHRVSPADTGVEQAIFAGEKSAFANKAALEEAKRIESQMIGRPATMGYDRARDLIWLRTGWFRGADGKWRFEIPDSGLAIKSGSEVGDIPTTQSKVIQHPELFQQYPTLLDGLKRWIGPDQAKTGFAQPGNAIVAAGPTQKAARGVVAHELQHTVQYVEGFARGGNPDEFGDIAARLSPQRAKDIAHQAYRSLAGEVEARNVEARLYMNEMDRKLTAPYLTEDTPRNRQAVMEQGEQAPSSPLEMPPRQSLIEQASGEQALAVRRGGGELNMEARRPAVGVPQQTGTALTTTAQTTPVKDIAILSTQQQARALADALDIPLFQGRNKAGTLATYNTKTGVIRTSEIADLQAVAHEVGHAIEVKVGSELTTITNAHAYELSALDYDPARGSIAEGFAEWARLYVTSQNYAQNMAPGFTTEFVDFMTRRHPKIMEALDTARASALAYYNAPSVDAVSAVRRSQADNPAGFAKVVDNVKKDGFSGSVKMVAQKLYEAFLDEKSPFARAVRDIARAIKKKEGGLIELKDANNPATLLRMLDRAHQAAVRDTMDGVRGYHSIAPTGPSLADAMAKATGEATIWGKWDSDKVASFADFNIARRVYVQWKKFERGEIPNPPASFSRADAMVAMADLERANPTFREASDMVHAWTRQLLKKMYDGHLIDADLYNKLIKEEFYVPLMRDLSDRPLSGGGAAGRGSLDQAPDVVKRFRGSTRDIISPLESLMTQSFLVNRTLRHNDVILAFETLAERAGPEGGKFFEPIKPTEMKKRNFDLRETVERLAHERGIDQDDIRLLSSSLTDMFGDDPIVGSFFHAEAAKGRGEPIVFYKRNGETRAARIMSKGDGEPLYEILTSLPKPLNDMYSLLIGTTSSVLRAGVTTNPMFALTNYIRDQLAVGILRSDYIPIVSGVKGLVDEVLQRESAVLYGYGGGVSAGASVSQYEAAIKSDINALAKKGYLVNRLTSVKGALELAAVTEAGTRNSVFGKAFKAKKAQGLSDYEALIEAAFAAQDILDFSRHGSRTEAMRRYVPFLNAFFQGMDKAGRTVVLPVVQKLRDDQVFASDPAQLRNAVFSATKVLGVGGVLGAMWAALHADKESYRDASPLLRGTHVVMPAGRNIVLIPKPFELGIGFTAGEYAYQLFAQNDQRSAAQFAEAAWDSMTGANPLYDIPLLKTAYELKLGKSVFTGRDIVPGELQGLDPKEQYTDKTSSLAKVLGQQIGVSPIKIDYTIGSMFGLWGRDVMALSSGVDPNAPDRSWEDMALVRRLLKDPDRTSNVTTKFWEYMGQTTGKYNQAVKTYENFLKSGRADRDQLAKEYISKLPSDQRAFVILRSAADDNGKPAFKADAKKLHPLQRAYDAVTILNQMRKELNDNSFKDFAEGQNTKLDPATRRYLIESVRELAHTELRNALVIMKEPGYTGRQLFDLDIVMEKIRSLSPVVYEEIRTRYATSKIPRTYDVATAYQKMKADLLRNGSGADPGDFVTGDYEFDGDRAKKPQKRRIEIAPSQIGIQ